MNFGEPGMVRYLRGPYVTEMRIFTSLMIIAAVSTPALSQVSRAELNALNDIAASQRSQTELMRRQAQRDSERAYRERNEYVNAKRDARSMRRFDRP